MPVLSGVSLYCTVPVGEMFLGIVICTIRLIMFKCLELLLTSPVFCTLKYCVRSTVDTSHAAGPVISTTLCDRPVS